MPVKTIELLDKRTNRTIALKVIDNGVATTRAEPVDRGKPSWLRAATGGEGAGAERVG